MQATEVKTEVELRAPATELPGAPAAKPPAAPTAERPQPPSADESSCCTVQSGQRRYRPWLIGGAVLAVPLLLYGGWDWLVAAGLSTFAIAMAPCLVMCALGLCMRGKSKDESSLAQIRKTYEAQPGEPPSRS